MITAKLCLVAEQILRDADTNTVSAINITEGAIVQGFPTAIPRLQFMAMWERDQSDDQEHTMSFTVHLDGKELGRVDGTIAFGDSLHTRTFVRLDGLMVPGPGLLVFQQKLTTGPEARYAMRLQAPPTPQGQAAGA